MRFASFRKGSDNNIFKQFLKNSIINCLYKNNKEYIIEFLKYAKKIGFNYYISYESIDFLIENNYYSLMQILIQGSVWIDIQIKDEIISK